MYINLDLPVSVDDSTISILVSPADEEPLDVEDLDVPENRGSGGGSGGGVGGNEIDDDNDELLDVSFEMSCADFLAVSCDAPTSKSDILMIVPPVVTCMYTLCIISTVYFYSFFFLLSFFACFLVLPASVENIYNIASKFVLTWILLFSF